MKSKGLKIIFGLFAFIVLFLIIGYLSMFVFPRKYKSPLNHFSTDVSGGMRGGRHSISIVVYDETHCLYSDSVQSWYNAVPETKEVLIDRAVLTELEEVFYQYRMRGWEKLPQSKVLILDGDTRTYQMTFGTDFWSYSSDQISPRNLSQAKEALYAVIERYVADGVPFPALVKDWEYPDDEFLYTAPDNELSGKVIDYSSKTLTVRIYNGTDEEISFKESYRLYPENTASPLYENAMYYSVTISSGGFQDIQINLNSYLDQDAYSLEFDTIAVPFRIQ